MAHIMIAERWWECPTCHFQHKTIRGGIITPMHRCPQMGGLEVPLVQVLHNGGIRPGDVHHRLVERQDYVGDERGVLYDAKGRAITAVHTERRDGSHDTHVFAPHAYARTTT